VTWLRSNWASAAEGIGGDGGCRIGADRCGPVGSRPVDPAKVGTDTPRAVTTVAEAAETAGTAAAKPPRRVLVIASRTSMIMLLVAGAALLGLGLLSLARADAPEVDGWLRTIFGRVFGIVAIAMAIILGTPSAIGLWAMAGARKEGSVPALPETPRRVIGGIAVATVVVTAAVLLATGSAVRVLNLGLLGLVALASLGLAGAVAYSPHRGRAILAAVALLLVVGGIAWVLVNAFIAPPIDAT
jgi:hypothetical protein